MFALRRLDVLPIGDLGIQAAMRKYYRKRRMPNPAEMEKIATCWSPYRTVACWYLWQILDMKAT
jgi:DNA-3-methyladenine glycosylase II